MTVDQLFQDRFNLIAELLDSSLKIEEKTNIVKKFVPSLNISNDELTFDEYKINTKQQLYKILAISNRISQETVNDAVINNTINDIKSSIESADQEMYKFNLSMAIVHFKTSFITEELREFFFGVIKVNIV